MTRKDRGPWRWVPGGKEWWLFGELPLGDYGYWWMGTCKELTGQDEPPEPVRIRVPFIGGLDGHRHFQYMVGCWRFLRVEAYPITSNGIRYSVWRDSRGVLRLVERA